MGKLSALFGLNDSRDQAQDDRMATIESRLSAVEARPAGGVDPTILERLTTLEERTVVDAAARQDVAALASRLTALETREVADGTARTAAANAAAAAAGATAAVGNLTSALDRVSARLAVIEQEFADLPQGTPGTPDDGGITLPEVKP